MGDELRTDWAPYRRKTLGLAIRDDRTRVALLDSNRAHLESVSSRIGAAILDFMRLHDGLNFFADDLRRHVIAQVGTVAPGSADRILRDLRQKGLIEYEVVNRAQSLYFCGART
jgi:hypothetical protein